MWLAFFTPHRGALFRSAIHPSHLPCQRDKPCLGINDERLRRHFRRLSWQVFLASGAGKENAWGRVDALSYMFGGQTRRVARSIPDSTGYHLVERRSNYCQERVAWIPKGVLRCDGATSEYSSQFEFTVRGDSDISGVAKTS